MEIEEKALAADGERNRAVTIKRVKDTLGIEVAAEEIGRNGVWTTSDGYLIWPDSSKANGLLVTVRCPDCSHAPESQTVFSLADLGKVIRERRLSLESHRCKKTGKRAAWRLFPIPCRR